MEKSSANLIALSLLAYFGASFVIGWNWGSLDRAAFCLLVGLSLLLWLPKEFPGLANVFGSPIAALNRLSVLRRLRRLQSSASSSCPRPPFLKHSAVAENSEEQGCVASAAEGEAERSAASGGSVTFAGSDEGGRAMGLAVKEGRLQWMFYRNDGETYTLLAEKGDARDDFFRSPEARGDSFVTGGGLTLTMLEPFRRWRLVYNGMMRRGSDGKVLHVRLNLIWVALAQPFDLVRDADLSAVAQGDLAADDDATLSNICDSLLVGVAQFGTLYGKICLADRDGGEEESELYLRGERTMATKSEEKARPSPSTTRRRAAFVGVADSGFHFAVNFAQVDQKQHVLGNLFIPGGDVYKMSSIDKPCFDAFQSAELCTEAKLRPQQVFFRFDAASRSFNAAIVLRPEGVQCLRRGRLLVVHADVTLNATRGRGMLIVETDHGSETILPSLEQPHPTFEGPPLSKSRSATPPLVVALDSEECLDPSFVGGKASSLASMLRCPDFALVPGGVAVTSAGMRAQLRRSPECERAIEEVIKMACREELEGGEEERMKRLSESCKKAVQALRKQPVIEEIAKAVTEYVNSTGGRGKIRFAVRSSALGEDSADLSAAGQNETFLGCSGVEAVTEAVAKCWASLYAFQSVEYRRQNGQEVNTSMGVVIQEMVDAFAAGVAFSRDPLTGDPSRIAVTANYGLGESVVSAVSEPDSVTVGYRPWEESEEQVWSLVERKRGSKEKMVVMNEQGSTGEVSTPDSLASELCLPDEEFVRIAKLALEAEKGFGGPRDVEFAVVKAEEGFRIYLLQARPITTADAWSDEELLHENDFAVSGQDDVHTKANVGEVIPGAISELTISTTERICDLQLQDTLGNQAACNAYAPLVLRVFAKNVLCNYLDSILQSVMDEVAVTKPLRAIDISVCGHDVMRKKDVEIAVERRGLKTGLAKVRQLLFVAKEVLTAVYWMKYGMKGLTAEEAERSSPHPPFDEVLRDGGENMSSREVLRIVKRDVHMLGPSLRRHCKISSASTTFQLILFLTLTENSDDWTSETYADAVSFLVSGLDDDTDVESAGVPEGLKALSEALSTCPEADVLHEKSVEEAEQWIKTNRGKMYDDFLRRFSHRCLREFELSSVSWGEDRTPLIRTIQASVRAKVAARKAGSETGGETHKTTLDTKIQNLSKPIQEGTMKALRFLYPLANGAVALREKSKSITILRNHQLKRAARVLGAALRREGFLPDSRLVYHLNLYELERLVDTRSPIFVQKAIRRKRLRPQWEEVKFDEMIYGIPKPLGEVEHELSARGEGESVSVEGTPGCKGVYKGPARVITKLEEAKTIKQGDVLVTVSTDIGWSPYFPLLGGVVTELGGLISHGAVVAREYGLPCVVGARGATAAFNTGDIVVVDGRKGSITKVD